MHTYLSAIRRLAQAGQQAYECARSYFIGNRGHDLNGSMSGNKGEQLHDWRDIVCYCNTSFLKSLKSLNSNNRVCKWWDEKVIVFV